MYVRIWLAIAAAAVGWGTGGVAVRAALADGVPPLGLAAIRAFMATAAMFVVLSALRRPWRRTAASLRLGVGLSFGNLVAPFILLTFAYRYVSAGYVGILLALVPVMTATIAHFWLKDEPLHRAKVLGLAVGFSGVLLLISSGDSGLEVGGRPFLAAVLAIGAVIAIAAANVYAKGESRTYDTLPLIAIQFASGTVILVLIALLFEGTPDAISAWGWTLLAYMAVAGTIAPNLLYYWVLRHVTSTQASMIGYLVPIVAVSTGMVFLDEQLQFGIVAGGIVILSGVVLIHRAETRLSTEALASEA